MHYIESIMGWILIVILGLIPLVFIPTTVDYYNSAKLLFLTLGALIVLLLFAIKLIIGSKFTINRSLSTIGFAALSIGSWTSLLVASTNKTQALLTPIGPVMFTAITILLALAGPMMDTKKKTILGYLISGCTGILGLVALYQFLDLGKAIFPGVSFLANSLWTPIGSTLGLLGILAIVCPLLGGMIRNHIKNHDVTSTILTSTLLLFVLIGAGVTIWQLSREPRYWLPYQTNWAMIMEEYKNPKQALFGVGPENFLHSFFSGKPLEINNTPLWNVQITTGSSALFHIMTTTGLVGGIGLMLLFTTIILILRHHKKDPGTIISLLVGIPVLIFLPPSLAVFVYVAAIALLADPDRHDDIHIHFSATYEWFGVLIAVVLAVSSLGIGYLTVRAYNAESLYARSFRAREKNDGTATYNLLIAAIARNPKDPRFHIDLSNTMLALANTLGNQQTGTAAATAKNRQLIGDLIQQSVREAKLAITYAPESPIAWGNLAVIYQSLVGAAQNADIWATASYQRAIQLDPVNPALRLALGGIYVQTGDLDSARDQYLAAAQMKPDLANAHYNLAFLYRQRKEYLRSAVELKRTALLVKSGSIDADRVASELNEVQKLLTPDELLQLEQAFSAELPSARETPLDQSIAPITQPSPALRFQNLTAPPLASPPATPQ